MLMNKNKWMTPRTVAAALGLALSARGGVVPAELPAPDGNPGDASKPVKVYVLAGQSNMVGFGTLSGSRPYYTAVYLTADPAAAPGPLAIYQGGNYRIAPLVVHNPVVRRPAGTTPIAYGMAGAQLLEPSSEPLVVTCELEVPETGEYTLQPGYGNSTYNVAELDGKEVYRKEKDGQAQTQIVTLEAGKRYALSVTYASGGSAALWLRQENLVGKGDLESLVRREKKFPWMMDDEGNWTVRKDVYYQSTRPNEQGSFLSATSNGNFIGPEVPFGFVMGAFHDEQVLLIESSMGNRALSFDFRPPSSGRTDPDNQFEAFEYNALVDGVRKTLAGIDAIVPGYQGQGYEIAGFVWWQGHKDAGQTKAQYEGHLVNLIKDLRRDLDAPDMKAVVATVGFGGWDMNAEYLEILKAQMAVGDPEQHPEFAGQVKSIDTRGFWRGAEESPTATGYHYNHNAETFMLTGDALGRAMVELMGGKAEPLGYGSRPAPEARTAVVAESDEAAKLATRTALTPIVMDGIGRTYLERNRAALEAVAKGERPARPSQYLRDAMFGLNSILGTIGITDYEWRTFGPDLSEVEWECFSFDPPETLENDRPGGRYRTVTYPAGMENWTAPDFDAMAAGFQRGLPPFGQAAGQLAGLRGCQGSPCGCGVVPRTLWAHEVLLVRTTVDLPPFKEGHRYRVVIGGSNHVNTGEGYAIYVNGKLLTESGSGVPNRQGGQPRGGHLYSDVLQDMPGGRTTIAVKSFLRYGVRGPSPQGHLTVWLEEQQLPAMVADLNR